MAGMFIVGFVSMFLIWYFQHKVSMLEQINDIYKSHWKELCNQMLAEIEKDGYCRLIVAEEEVKNMIDFLDVGGDRH